MPYCPREPPSHQEDVTDDDKDKNNSQDVPQENKPGFNVYEHCHRLAWHRTYTKLVAYLNTYGNWPHYTDREHKTLFTWLYRQRDHYRSGKLSDEEKKKLNDIGFSWKGSFSKGGWRPRDKRIATSSTNDQGSSTPSIPSPEQPVDVVMDTSNDCNNNNNNNNNPNHEANYENFDHSKNNQNEGNNRNERNETKHDDDDDNDGNYHHDDLSSCCSDIVYNHSDDEDEDEKCQDEEDEGVDTNIQQVSSHPIVPVVTSSRGAAQNGGQPSQQNQDTIVADTIASSSIPLQQSTIRTTVARLPTGDEEDHRALSGISGLESVSLWVANQQIQLRRVSEEELRQLDQTGVPSLDLPPITTMGIGGDRQVDVGEGDRKVSATGVNGIVGDAREDETRVIANSPTPGEHVVQQEPDGCGSSSPRSRNRRRMDPPESHVSKRLRR